MLVSFSACFCHSQSYLSYFMLTTIYHSAKSKPKRVIVGFTAYLIIGCQIKQTQYSFNKHLCMLHYIPHFYGWKCIRQVQIIKTFIANLDFNLFISACLWYIVNIFIGGNCSTRSSLLVLSFISLLFTPISRFPILQKICFPQMQFQKEFKHILSNV